MPAAVQRTVARLVGRLRQFALVTYRLSPYSVRRFVISFVTPGFAVGAVVVLRRPDGRILLVEQRHTGQWAFPGGLLRRHEDPADAAVREAGEEVGLRLDPAALHPGDTIVDVDRRVVDVVFSLDVDDALEPRRHDPVEVMSIGWFDPHDPRALPAVTAPTRVMLGRMFKTP